MKNIIYFLGLAFLLITSAMAQDSAANLQNLLNQPLAYISGDVWKKALTSYLSKCKGNCPCSLVVAEGISGNDTSAKMWIGTFKGGSAVELWSGRASRLANSGQNDTSVNMDTNLCKRRNGVASVAGDNCCIPGRTCRSCSVYKSIAADLGLPDTVELTSFYFSTPMHNETYKFHDFYGCPRNECPATLGCLGLERHAMKALCMNHMGSDGSNGVTAPERGGTWLYFHNINAPPSSGSEEEAKQGLERLARGEICTDTSTAHLGSGQLMSPGDYAIDPQSTSPSSNNTAGHKSNDSTDSNSGGGGNGGQLAAASIGAVGVVAGAYYASKAGDDAADAEADEAAGESRGYCRDSITKSCEMRTQAEIDQYCSKPIAYDRVGCTFTLLSQSEVEERERNLQ